jgi:bifunctional ADP-heptose synthase (sugar kinase/adenylyltransferase)
MQKETIRQMRNVQKQVREIKLPSINYNRIIAQSQELIRVKKESDKNYKLSLGMLTALSKMDKELDDLKQKREGGVVEELS